MGGFAALSSVQLRLESNATSSEPTTLTPAGSNEPQRAAGADFRADDVAAAAGEGLERGEGRRRNDVQWETPRWREFSVDPDEQQQDGEWIPSSNKNDLGQGGETRQTLSGDQATEDYFRGARRDTVVNRLKWRARRPTPTEEKPFLFGGASGASEYDKDAIYVSFRDLPTDQVNEIDAMNSRGFTRKLVASKDTRVEIENDDGGRYYLNFANVGENSGLELFSSELNLVKTGTSRHSKEKRQITTYADYERLTLIKVEQVLIEDGKPDLIDEDIARQMDIIYGANPKGNVVFGSSAGAMESPLYKNGVYFLRLEQNATITPISGTHVRKIHVEKHPEGQGSSAVKGKRKFVYENDQIVYYKEEVDNFPTGYEIQFLNSNKQPVLIIYGEYGDHIDDVDELAANIPISTLSSNPSDLALKAEKFITMHNERRASAIYSLLSWMGPEKKYRRQAEEFSDDLFVASNDPLMQIDPDASLLDEDSLSNYLEVVKQKELLAHIFWGKNNNKVESEMAAQIERDFDSAYRYKNSKYGKSNNKESGLSKSGRDTAERVLYKSYGYYLPNSFDENLTETQKREKLRRVAHAKRIHVRPFSINGVEFFDILRIDDLQNNLILLYFPGRVHTVNEHVNTVDPFFPYPQGPFIEFKSPSDLEAWVRLLAADHYGRFFLRQHAKLEDRAEKTAQSGKVEHGLDYILDHIVYGTKPFTNSPSSGSMSEDVDFFRDMARRVKEKQFADFAFINNRLNYLLSLLSKESSQDDLLRRIVVNVNKKYMEKTKREGESLEYSGARKYAWRKELEPSFEKYKNVSDRALDEVFKRHDFENMLHPGIIKILQLANEIQLSQLRNQLQNNLKNKSRDNVYWRALQIVYHTLFPNPPLDSEISLYKMQVDMTNDLISLGEDDNGKKEFRDLWDMSWALAARAYMDSSGPDFEYGGKSIIKIAGNAKKIDGLVGELHKDGGSKKGTVTSIANVLGVYAKWSSLIEKTPESEILSVFSSPDVGSELDVLSLRDTFSLYAKYPNYVRIAESYVRKKNLGNVGEYSEFAFQAEVGKVLRELSELPAGEADDYPAIDEEAMNIVGSEIFKKEDDPKRSQSVSATDFFRRASQKSLELLFEKIENHAEPYWRSLDGDADIDPTGTVKRKKLDIQTTISGYREPYNFNLQEFFDYLDKALDEPFEELGGQFVRLLQVAGGNYSEEDVKYARKMGRGIKDKILNVADVSPFAPLSAGYRVVAAGAKFTNNRIKKGGSLGKDDAKQLALIIWTPVAYGISNKLQKAGIDTPGGVNILSEIVPHAIDSVPSGE